MNLREKTKKITIGNITLGGSNNVLIQSMCDIKTSNTNQVIKQINECAKLGASMMRVSILDENDANAIKIIKANTTIPIIGDIHFSTKLAKLAIKNGIDKIRINPINTPKNELLDLINFAKDYNVAIRIGLNEGSTTHQGKNINSINKLIQLTKDTISFFEKNNFFNLVVSIKSSDALKTIKIYKKLAKEIDYPLHIGVTESGFDDIGIIRSTIGLSNLLISGIGNTIRVSLTKNPKLEILTAKRMLHDLKLYPNYPTIISCPTCGRCKVKNLDKLASDIAIFLEENNLNIKIAIMGCIVNGIGEGKNADIGIAGANGKFIKFKNKKVLKITDEKNIISDLKKEILNLS